MIYLVVVSEDDTSFFGYTTRLHDYLLVRLLAHTRDST
jgi:hypothetical protein